jgi:tRNA(fMet)-specific endonuclease VapC
VKFLLDTDHLSILQRQSGPEYAILSGRIAQHSPADLSLAVVSFHEQVLGCHTYLSRARTSADVVRGYGMLGRLLGDYAATVVLPFDTVAAAVFDGLVAQRVRIGTMDLRIASIALSRGLIVLTRNTSDFSQVPALLIENWTV